MTKTGYHRLRSVFSLGIALIVLSLVIVYRHQLMIALTKIKVPWVLTGLAIYMVNYALRALRLKVISGQQIHWWPEGLYASCAHGFTTYIIPFRAGDLALPVILRSVTQLDLAAGGSILVKARLLDAQSLGLWILIAAVWTDFPLANTLYWGWVVTGVFLFSLPWLVQSVGSMAVFQRIGVVKKLSFFVAGTTDDRYTFTLSVSIWLAIAGCYYCAARAVGIGLAPMQVWLLITIQLPLQLLPVQGVAGTGAHEGGWVAGLMLLGTPMAAAVEYSLTSHIVILIYVMSLGPLAIFFGRFCRPMTVPPYRRRSFPQAYHEDRYER